MRSRSTFIHSAVAAVFVTAAMALALTPAPVLHAASYALTQDRIESAGTLLQAYLIPSNVLMRALLLSVLGMVVLDCVARGLDERDQGGADADPAPGPVRAPLLAALLVTSVSLLTVAGNPPLLALGLLLATGLALIAARRAAGKRRPAIGFLAGWLTALASAAAAAAIGHMVDLPLPAIAALAILPAAAVGIVAQFWIGGGFGYSAALIWAFCALAIAAMGSDPTIAIMAIVGIATMAVALVRVAS